MKNNSKGFAISGILYAILILFLMLILLILVNFQSRRVLFDKQKMSVYEKLNQLEIRGEYLYSPEIQEFIADKDGVYLLEAWGSGDGCEYVKGELFLYQGIRLYIKIGTNGGSTSIRTEKLNSNTIILKAAGKSDGGSFGYSTGSSDNSDIKVGKLKNYDRLTKTCPAKSINKNGYVTIKYLGDSY